MQTLPPRLPGAASPESGTVGRMEIGVVIFCDAGRPRAYDSAGLVPDGKRSIDGDRTVDTQAPETNAKTKAWDIPYGP